MYGTRVWSGGDYPKTPPVRKTAQPLEEVYERYMRAGKELTRVRWKRKFLPRVSTPKRGRTVDHDYTMSDSRITDAVVNYQRPNISGNTWKTITAYGNGLFRPYATYSWDSSCDYTLFGRLRNRVAGSSFNAGVFLGEGHEACSMIADAARRIRLSLLAVRRGNFVSAARHLTSGTSRSQLHRQHAASNWLELQYGWLPLLSDVYDGAQFLAHQFSVPLQDVVRVKLQVAGAIRNSWGTFAPILESNCYTRKTIKAILKEKDVVKLSGLTDPLSVAWELVPYSFVVDWFLPVGDYLSSRGLSQSLTGTYVTSTKNYGFGKGFYYAGTDNDWKFDGTNHEPFHEWVSFTRTVSTNLSIPMPEVIPLNQVLSWRRAANAVALLTNRESSIRGLFS